MVRSTRFAALVVVPLAASAVPLGPAFTCQGFLRDSFRDVDPPLKFAASRCVQGMGRLLAAFEGRRPESAPVAASAASLPIFIDERNC